MTVAATPSANGHQGSEAIAAVTAERAPRPKVVIHRSMSPITSKLEPSPAIGWPEGVGNPSPPTGRATQRPVDRRCGHYPRGWPMPGHCRSSRSSRTVDERVPIWLAPGQGCRATRQQQTLRPSRHAEATPSREGRSARAGTSSAEPHVGYGSIAGNKGRLVRITELTPARLCVILDIV